MVSLQDIQFKLVVHSFSAKRGDWYDYVAAMLGSSAGGIKLLELLENDAIRYGKQPRGILSQHWYNAYLSNGGNLADALEGTLPSDEVAILRVAQDSGADALVVALKDLTRIVRIGNEAKNAAVGILIYAMVGVLVALASSTFMPIVIWSQLTDAFSMLPKESWGPKAKLFDGYVTFIKDYWLHCTVLFGAILYLVYWTFDGLLGSTRKWLDEHIALYQIARDLKAALFLSTMCTLTKQRSGISFTLRRSLEIFQQSVSSRWFSWRIGEVIERIDLNGDMGSDVFDTGILSQEMYYFLSDMQRAKGFSQGFEVTAAYVESTLIQRVIKRMNVYKWILVGISMLVSLGVYVFIGVVQGEMQSAMKTFLSNF